MAQRILLYMPSDDEIISSSPLTYVDTLYYELWYRIAGSANYNQVTQNSPLPIYNIATSPSSDMPCLVIDLLPDATDYEYKVRRFNHDGQPSDWFTGTFTTGS